MPVGTDRILPVRLFADLPAGDIEQVAALAGELGAAAGNAVASAEDFGHTLYAIESGEVDIVQDGRAIRRIGPGDVFREIALVKSGRRTASAIAATDCHLLTWFKRDVWRLEDSAPGFSEALRASAHLAADDAP